MRLTTPVLLAAYARGYFPMAEPGGEVAFYSADPRGIIPLDAFHVPTRLARTVRGGRFEVRVDTAFADVIAACAAPDPRRTGREETWISDELIEAYTRLHRRGFAHSIEAWEDGMLAGGLYGVALRGLFAGESMFSHRTDASKVALVHLVERLRHRGYVLLDSQFLAGDHLRQFGAIEISAEEYRTRLETAMLVDARFADAPG